MLISRQARWWLKIGIGSLLLLAPVVWLAPPAAADPNAGPADLWATLEASNQHLSSQSAYVTTVTQQLTVARSRLDAATRHTAAARANWETAAQHLLPLLRYQYEYGQEDVWMWVSALLSAHTWGTWQQVWMDLRTVESGRLLVLHNAATTWNSYTAQEKTLRSRVEDLTVLATNLNYEKALYQSLVHGTAGNVTMTDVRQTLAQTWAQSIAPEIDNVLTQLDELTYRLPDQLPKSDLQMGFGTATVKVPQDLFNQLLKSIPGQESVQFYFRPNRLLVVASSSKHMVLLDGHFAIAPDGRKATYVVDNVAVDGILLPSATAAAWLSSYSFYFDLSHLSSHLRLSRIQVTNRELDLELGLSVQ